MDPRVRTRNKQRPNDRANERMTGKTLVLCNVLQNTSIIRWDVKKVFV